MSRPTRDTPAGRAYLDLRNRARREGRTTQELLTLYVLERWLARLVASRHADHLPTQLADIVVAMTAFVDPLMTGDVGAGVWSPAARLWA